MFWNDRKHENNENDEDNSDSYKQGVECWIGGNHGSHGNKENCRNPGCKPRVPQTTGLEIPEQKLGAGKTKPCRFQVVSVFAQWITAWLVSYMLKRQEKKAATWSAQLSPPCVVPGPWWHPATSQDVWGEWSLVGSVVPSSCSSHASHLKGPTWFLSQAIKLHMFCSERISLSGVAWAVDLLTLPMWK